MREVAAECANPALLFSGGKDSIVLLRLAEKAFRPGRFPFPLLHVDTGHNFPEVIEFRDRRAKQLGERLIVRSMEDSIRQGRVVLRSENQSRNPFQSVTLLDAIAEFRLRCLYRRGTPRRGKGSGQGTHIFLPGRIRSMGSEEPAAGIMGSSTIPACIQAKIFVYFPSATGPNSMCGNTLRARNWRCRTFISPIHAMSSGGVTVFCRYPIW